jgi:transposase
MVAECRHEHASEWATIESVAAKLGIGTAQTLHAWVRRDQIDSGRRAGVTSDMAAEVRKLRAENKELKRANEILKSASVFFAAALCATRRRVDRGRVRDPVGLAVAAAG